MHIQQFSIKLWILVLSQVHVMFINNHSSWLICVYYIWCRKSYQTKHTKFVKRTCACPAIKIILFLQNSITWNVFALLLLIRSFRSQQWKGTSQQWKGVTGGATCTGRNLWSRRKGYEFEWASLLLLGVLRLIRQPGYS